MELTQEACYRAVRAHDARFDGVFFTCVQSTGIYCRPICTARLPKLEYCLFVRTATEAERQGYRPCLRCRPERAPLERGGNTLVNQVAAHIDDTLLADEKLADVAEIFGVSDRHMRRLFLDEFGVEPLRYVTTRRLLFAKQLLQDTVLPVQQIAYAAGFGSVGRLTIQMKRVYKMTPAELRKATPASKDTTLLTLRTDYRPPFDWSGLLTFLGRRATPLEWIDDGAYHRIVDGHEVVVRNVAARHYLTIQIPIALARQSHTILKKVRTVFDLDANPMIIEESLSHDPLLRKIIGRHPGVRVPGAWDPFEAILRTIVGQQVSVAGAATVMRRFVNQIGCTPAEVAASTPEEIAKLGMPGQRAQTLWTVGDMVHRGALHLHEPDRAIFYNQLIALPGVGPWTAEYLCMRILHWPDAFPAGDLGLQKAVMPGERLTERQIEKYSERWRPWRSYATILLWKSLDS